MSDVCTCMYVCTYIIMYVHVYEVGVHNQTKTITVHVRAHACDVCTCMHVCMYVCMYVRMYICMHLFISERAQSPFMSIEI